MYPEFLILKLLNVSNKDALSVCKSLLRSAINKRNKELQHFSKELSLSKQLSTTDFTSLENLYHRITRYCCRNRYTRNKKSYLQLTYIHRKLLLISGNMNYHRKNLIYLKQIYIFQSNQIKIENLKS